MPDTAQKICLLSILFLLLGACGTGSHRPQKLQGSVSIASFDVDRLVENSTQSLSTAKMSCDRSASDSQMLKCFKSDWTEEKLNLKLKRIAQTILAITPQGPDILILQEVESLKLLNRLNDDYLSEAGYRTVSLIETGRDTWKNTAVLSRFHREGKATLHPISFAPDPQQANWKSPASSGILEVPLRLPDGERMIVYAFEFPSSASHTEERQDAIAFLNGLMADKTPGTVAIAAGDSHISDREEAIFHLQSQVLASHWMVSHLVGCSGCQGTELDRGSWSFFQLMLFSPSLGNEGTAPYQLSPESIRVVKNGVFQMHPDGTPAAFDEKSSVGVSSYLPVYAEILQR